MATAAASPLSKGMRNMSAPLLLALVLAACQLTQQQRAIEVSPPAAPAAPEIPAGPTPEQLEIERLLAEAADALADDRLMTPPEDCAYYRYLRVLYLDPDNPAARIGLGDIVERYLTSALQAAESRRFVQAEANLESARNIDVTHPNIAPVARQIEELKRSASIRYRLPAEELRARSSRAAEMLRRIAAEITHLKATVVITARTDAEGRWIYQQLNDATGARVRAKLQIGTPPAIELLSPPS